MPSTQTIVTDATLDGVNQVREIMRLDGDLIDIAPDPCGLLVAGYRGGVFNRAAVVYSCGLIEWL